MGELQCILVFSEFFLPERNYDILVHSGFWKFWKQEVNVNMIEKL